MAAHARCCCILKNLLYVFFKVKLAKENGTSNETPSEEPVVQTDAKSESTEVDYLTHSESYDKKHMYSEDHLYLCILLTPRTLISTTVDILCFY